MKDVDSSRFTNSRCFGSKIQDSRFTFFTDSRFHIAFLVVLILLIYSNTLNAPFQWDEDEFLVNNPIVSNLHYFVNPSDAKGFQYYGHLMERYVGYLTFALDCRVHGFSVPGYHIVNIAIHIANSVLVYLFILLTFRTPFFRGQEPGVSAKESENGSQRQGPGTRSQGQEDYSQSLERGYQSLVPGPWSLTPKLVAFFSAALFAVHPIQTEAVTYVFQRFVPLAALFSLISLTAYARSRLAESRQQRLLFYCIAFISAVLAMKTKEIAFTLPLVITLYEFCFFSPSPGVRVSQHPGLPLSRRLLYVVPMLLTMSVIPLTLVYMRAPMSAGKQDLPGVSYAMLPRWEYMLTQFRVIVTYVRLLFMPVNQNFDYDYPVFKSFFDPQVLLSFVLISVLLGLAVYFICSSRFTFHDSRSFRLIGFGILWFFITLSVESSIVPLDRLIDEYRLYLPSVGISIAVVTGLFLLQRFLLSRFTIHYPRSFSDSRTIIVLLVVAGVLSIAAYNRNGVWGDKIGLWEDTVEKSPRSAEAHYSLGVAYQNLNMPDKAMEQYLTTIILRPDYVEAHNNLGNIYKTFNMPEKAVEQYQFAIKLKPDYAEAYFNLGSFLYYRMGEKEEARRELIAGLKIKPDDQEAQQLLNEISR